MNRAVLLIFAPILVLTGLLGFVVPPHASLVSGAPAYNLFHIGFGVIGLLIALMRRAALVRAFNIGFGAIDLYQAIASVTHLFPERLFQWTRTDDVLHVIIGFVLVVVGLHGRRSKGVLEESPG